MAKEKLKQKIFRFTEADEKRLLELRKELCIRTQADTLKFAIKILHDAYVKKKPGVRPVA